MKIRMIFAVQHGTQVLRTGEVHDLAEEYAAPMVEKGLAEKVSALDLRTPAGLVETRDPIPATKSKKKA